MILIVVLIVVVILLMVALIIAIPLRRRSRPPEPESRPSLDEVYQSYLASMHNEAVRYLRGEASDEAPGDREWIEGIKAQARANVGVVSWFEIDFDRLQHIRELNPTYVEMPSEFVAYARAS